MRIDTWCSAAGFAVRAKVAATAAKKMGTMAAVGAVMIFGGAPVATAQDYIVTNLGSLNGGEVHPAGMNEYGHVVGWEGFFPNDQDPFLWTPSGGMVALPFLPGGTAYAEAFDINNNGVIVGIAQNSSGARRAVKWQNGTIIDLGALGSSSTLDSGALGLNDKGEVVGYAENGQVDVNGWPIRRAVKWSANNVIQDLGVLPGGDTHSYAYDINNYGVACGYSDDGPGGAFVRHPVKYENGTVTFLGSLGGTFGHAWAINDAGEIAGDSYLTGNSRSRAFKWSNGVLKDVGALTSTSYSYPTGINTFGQMSGISPNTSLPQAVRWVGANDTIQNINNFMPPGSPTMDSAEDVNGVGQVIVEASGFPFGGYLLTPPVKQLPLYGPDPGLVGRNNTFTVYGATPGATIRFYYGLRTGSTVVPGCPGVDIDINAATFGGAIVANADGRASITGFTPNGARGRTVYYQATEQGTCRVSNRVGYRYP